MGFQLPNSTGCFAAKVAEATESRLRRQAEQEETARRRAEEAQQRAKKRHLETVGNLWSCWIDAQAVGHIYLQNCVVFWGVNVGKYNIH